MTDITGLETATQLAAMVRAKQISSRELLDLYLGRVERMNPVVNAVVTQDGEAAHLAATRADNNLAAGRPVGPLHGLPVTIKDAIEVAGLRSTGGARELTAHTPSTDAPAGFQNSARGLKGWRSMAATPRVSTSR